MSPCPAHLSEAEAEAEIKAVNFIECRKLQSLNKQTRRKCKAGACVKQVPVDQLNVVIVGMLTDRAPF